jgi:ABC-type dipeptide/oligopeptide/nickel transport system ATPase component
MADSLSFTRLRIQAGNQVLVDTSGFQMSPGEITVLVGASGSGKTLTARSLLGLVPPMPGVVDSDLCFSVGGTDHRPYENAPSPRERHARFEPLRGHVIGYLPQNARASLNPVWRIGKQISRCCRLQGGATDPIPWLQKAGFESPERVARLYPHELSGGMAQRASIALVLARGSRFILADEPTTGLDPTVQERILKEMLHLRDTGVSILFITHDLRIVPQIANHLLVMHEGALVEKIKGSDTTSLGSAPAKALWTATARIAGAHQ